MNDPNTSKNATRIQTERQSLPIDRLEKITSELIDKLCVHDQDQVYVPNLKSPPLASADG